MKIIEILGDDRDPIYTKIVEGCRGILVRDGKILLSYYKNEDRYLIPGGGIEADEDLAHCCARELAEETGAVVNPHTHYLTLEEYYHEYYFKSHYFVCALNGKCDQSLTENELKSGLEPRWVDLTEAIEMFSTFEQYKGTDEVLYGVYYREYIALTEYMGGKKNESY